MLNICLKKKIGFFFVVVLFFLLMSPVAVLENFQISQVNAQTPPDSLVEPPPNPALTPPPEAKIPQLVNPVGTENINTIIARVTKALLGIIGTISFLVFVISGIRLILSGGSEDRIKKAKDSMVWAVIGIAISLGSYAILSKVLDILTGGSSG